MLPGRMRAARALLAFGETWRRELIGTGIPEGIVAPQTAATASVGGAMIPLMTMGIPGSGATEPSIENTPSVATSLLRAPAASASRSLASRSAISLLA